MYVYATTTQVHLNKVIPLDGLLGILHVHKDLRWGIRQLYIHVVLGCISTTTLVWQWRLRGSHKAMHVACRYVYKWTDTSTCVCMIRYVKKQLVHWEFMLDRDIMREVWKNIIIIYYVYMCISLFSKAIWPAYQISCMLLYTCAVLFDGVAGHPEEQSSVFVSVHVHATQHGQSTPTWMSAGLGFWACGLGVWG